MKIQILRIILCLAFTLGVPIAASALTETELCDTWIAWQPNVQKDKMLGQIKWLSVTFKLPQEVLWEWERDGKLEKHHGNFSIVAEEKKIAGGVVTRYKISINPKTLSVYGPIEFYDVVVDMDNRFTYGQTVLKWKDDLGHWGIFLHQRNAQK